MNLEAVYNHLPYGRSLPGGLSGLREYMEGLDMPLLLNGLSRDAYWNQTGARVFLNGCHHGAMWNHQALAVTLGTICYPLETMMRQGVMFHQLTDALREGFLRLVIVCRESLDGYKQLVTKAPLQDSQVWSRMTKNSGDGTRLVLTTMLVGLYQILDGTHFFSAITDYREGLAYVPHDPHSEATVEQKSFSIRLLNELYNALSRPLPDVCVGFNSASLLYNNLVESIWRGNVQGIDLPVIEAWNTGDYVSILWRCEVMYASF